MDRLHAQWRVTGSDDLGPDERCGLRRLWADAFGDRFDDHDAAHAYGGIHVIASNGERPVAHASAVPRRLRVGSVWHEAAYVEAVAVAPDLHRTGVGTQAMTLLQAEVARRWPFAMLSTGRATGFYERLGWVRWSGESVTVLADGSEVVDGEHGGLMLLRLGSEVDPALPVACEDRPGDAW